MSRQWSDRSHSDPNNGLTAAAHNGLTVLSVVRKHIREQLLAAADILVVFGVFDAAAGASSRMDLGQLEGEGDDELPQGNIMR